VYETRFLFDTFGRMLRITYPDGEVLTNRYDSGGNLASAEGVKAVATTGADSGQAGPAFRLMSGRHSG